MRSTPTSLRELMWPSVRALTVLRACLVLFVLLFSWGCRQQDSGQRVRGSFGVLYGGQIQQLPEVSWDAAGPTELGFRVEIPELEVESAHRLHWELVRPGPEGRRVTLVRDFALEAGRKQFDQLIEIPPYAPLGTINLRVLVDRQLVIDRALVLRLK